MLFEQTQYDLNWFNFFSTVAVRFADVIGGSVDLESYLSNTLELSPDIISILMNATLNADAVSTIVLSLYVSPHFDIYFEIVVSWEPTFIL